VLGIILAQLNYSCADDSSLPSTASSSSGGFYPCDKNCSYPHGDCRQYADRFQCICAEPYDIKTFCATIRTQDPPYKGWGTAVWIAMGIIFSVICLERLYASCKKVYRRRQGREGFSQLPVTDNDPRINPFIHGHPDDEDWRSSSNNNSINNSSSTSETQLAGL